VLITYLSVTHVPSEFSLKRLISKQWVKFC